MLISNAPILGKTMNNKNDMCPNLLYFSRVPLATLSSNAENLLPADSTPETSSLGYALKLPARYNSEPLPSTLVSTPTSSTIGASPNSQKNRRKQTLSWKKPRMRDSWSK